MKRLTPTSRKQGFTLVELLVVIGIIVILMGLIFSVISPMNNRARRLQAENAVRQIIVGTNAYYTEYAKFPTLEAPGVSPANPERDQWVGDPAMSAPNHNNALFYTLRGIPKGPNVGHAANPRRVAYTENFNAATVSANGVPRGGYFDRDRSGGTPPAEVAGCLYDPWGREYGVIMDTTGDGRIDLAGIYIDFTGAPDTGDGKAPFQRSGAFSMGKDEKLGNKGDLTFARPSEVSDDVLSWR